jgi:hydroxypyruvate reductase
VLLSGGETTVTVKPRTGSSPTSRQAAGQTAVKAAVNSPGRGGRATEFLLGAAIALQGQPGVWLLSADTDGIDGSEDNAGAVATPDTLARAAALGLKPADFLDRNDAYSFFHALGDLVVPGPTFTNVNDFRALMVL